MTTSRNNDVSNRISQAHRNLSTSSGLGDLFEINLDQKEKETTEFENGELVEVEDSTVDRQKNSAQMRCIEILIFL